MKSCKVCNHKVNNEDTFCPKCGRAEFKEIASSQTSGSNSRINTNKSVYAGFWARLSAFVIDYCILALLLVTVWLFILLFAQLASLPFVLSFLLLFISNVAVIFLYPAWFEASDWQATPGKRMLGMCVQDAGGRPPTLLRALFRNVGKLFSSVTLNIGFIMAGFTEKKQALHDKLVDLYVVNTKPVNLTQRILYPVGFAVVTPIAIFLGTMVFVLIFGEPVNENCDPLSGNFTNCSSVFSDTDLNQPLSSSSSSWEIEFKDYAMDPPSDGLREIKRNEITMTPVPKIGEANAYGSSLSFDHKIALSTKQKGQRSLEVAYFRGAQKKANLAKYKKLGSLANLSAIKKAKLRAPDLVVQVYLSPTAKTCNEFNYESVHLTFIKNKGGFNVPDKSKTIELDYPSWRRFEKKTKLNCQLWNGTKVTGLLSGAKHDKLSNEYFKWNLNLNSDLHVK